MEFTSTIVFFIIHFSVRLCDIEVFPYFVPFGLNGQFLWIKHSINFCFKAYHLSFAMNDCKLVYAICYCLQQWKFSLCPFTYINVTSAKVVLNNNHSSIWKEGSQFTLLHDINVIWHVIKSKCVNFRRGVENLTFTGTWTRIWYILGE